MKIKQSIAGLYNGVSQQAPSLRKETQCEEQVNGYSSLERGVEKRPPTEHVAKISDISTESLFTHRITRDKNEKYQILIDNVNGVTAYDLSQDKEAPVYNYEGDWSYFSGVSNYTSDISITTIADFSFILNKNKVVEIDDTETFETELIDGLYRGYVYLVQPQWGIDYTLDLNIKDGSSAPAGSITRSVDLQNTTTPFKTGSTHVFESNSNGSVSGTGAFSGGTTSIKASLEAAGYTVTLEGSLMEVAYTEDFYIEASDSFGNNAWLDYKSNIQDADRLPEKAFNNIRWKVAGTAGADQANGSFYVEYLDDVWTESRGWNQYNIIKASTMPHILKSYLYDSTETYYTKDDSGNDVDVTANITALGLSNGDSFFIYERATWEDRLVGDDDTVPMPSFINKKINDIFFYKNRLGFLAGESVILSKSNSYFDFFPTSVTTIMDDDPIDLSVGIQKVTKLYHATPFSDELIIFSDFTQFRLTSSGSLTPLSVDLDVTTEYEATDSAKPVGIGSYVYFPVPQGDYTGIREFYVNKDSNTKEANEATAHVARYLPKNIVKLTGSSNENILAALSSEDGYRNRVYIHKMFFGREGKIMSSWSYWEIEEGAKILDLTVSDAVIDLVVLRDNSGGTSDYKGIYLEQIDIKTGLNDEGLDFRIYLDRKTSDIGMVYNETTNTTTFTLPYHEVDDVTLVITGGDFDNKADKLTTVKVDENTLESSGDYTTGTVYAGKNYTFSYKFSEFFYREQTMTTEKSNYKSHSLGSNLMLLVFYLDYIDSGRFKVTVSSQGSNEMIYESFGQLSTNEVVIGSPIITSGTFNCPILSRPEDVTITITNDDYLPSYFQSAEWLGNLRTIGRRI